MLSVVLVTRAHNASAFLRFHARSKSAFGGSVLPGLARSGVGYGSASVPRITSRSSYESKIVVILNFQRV